MGFRAWLTRVEVTGDWDFLKKAIEINPLAYGVEYIIDIAEDIPELCKGIWVAWSGDCSCSLTEFMPAMFIDCTVHLDDVLDTFPAFHEGNGPTDYGKYLPEETVEPLLEERETAQRERQERT